MAQSRGLFNLLADLPAEGISYSGIMSDGVIESAFLLLQQTLNR